MKQNTTFDKIKLIIQQQGYVDNYFCIDNYITTRLSAQIYNIKENHDVKFRSVVLNKGEIRGSKNCYYIVEDWGTLRPTRTARITAKKMIKMAKSNKLRNFQE